MLTTISSARTDRPGILMGLRSLVARIGVLVLGPAAVAVGLWLLPRSSGPGGATPVRAWTDLVTTCATVGLCVWGGWWSLCCLLACVARVRTTRTGVVPGWAQRLPRRCLTATGLATTVALGTLLPAQAATPSVSDSVVAATVHDRPVAEPVFAVHDSERRVPAGQDAGRRLEADPGWPLRTGESGGQDPAADASNDRTDRPSAVPDYPLTKPSTKAGTPAASSEPTAPRTATPTPVPTGPSSGGAKASPPASASSSSASPPAAGPSSSLPSATAATTPKARSTTGPTASNGKAPRAKTSPEWAWPASTTDAVSEAVTAAAAAAAPGDAGSSDDVPSSGSGSSQRTWRATRPSTDLPATLGGARREEVVVSGGDTLWDLAAEHLGPSATDHDIAQEWRLWYQANRDVIGADPDLIVPGTRLLPPSG